MPGPGNHSTSLDPIVPDNAPPMARWAVALVAMAVLPGALMALGINFDSQLIPIEGPAFSQLPTEQLQDAIQTATRGMYVHTLLEWSACCAALLVAIVAMAQHRVSPDPSLVIISITLVGAGASDLFHILSADYAFGDAIDASPFLPFSWTVSRFTKAILPMIAFAVIALRPQANHHNKDTFLVLTSCLVLIGFSYSVIHTGQQSDRLPQMIFEENWIKRPYDLLVVVPFAFSAFVVYPLLLKKSSSIYGWAMLLSVIPDVGAQIYMAFGSAALHDASFNIARGLKIVAYTMPLVGVAREWMHRQRSFESLTHGLKLNSQKLRDRNLELESARFHFANTAGFATSLNHVDDQVAYQTSLGYLVAEARIPYVALFYADDGLPRCIHAQGLDHGPIGHEGVSGEGLPTTVISTGCSQSLTPHGLHTIRFTAGLAQIEVTEIIGWPIVYEEETIGALLTYHVAPMSEGVREFLSGCLPQLATRIHAFALEEHRKTLLSDLEHKSCQLSKAREESDRANQSKSDFLASMSHELRTPMNSIIGFTRRLLKRLGSDLQERDRDALETVDRNAKHLLSLINDILDFSKIEAGKMDFEPRNCDLTRTLHDCVTQVLPMAEAKGLRLGHPDLSRERIVVADETKMRQVFLNLLSNAIKYTDQGSVEVSLEPSSHGTREGYSIRVRDTGIGIAEADRHQLFQRFSQLDAAEDRKVGGTGLGLSITASYVAMHGGEINVCSRDGEGSEFEVWIPTSTLPKAQVFRVACDIDDAQRRRNVESALSRLGLDPKSNGDAPPHLVISDTPDHGGREDVPVVLLAEESLAPDGSCPEEELLATIHQTLARHLGDVLVLLGDDASRSRVRTHLESMGIRTREGAKAPTVFRESKPSVVLVDASPSRRKVWSQLEESDLLKGVPAVTCLLRDDAHEGAPPDVVLGEPGSLESLVRTVLSRTHGIECEKETS